MPDYADSSISREEMEAVREVVLARVRMRTATYIDPILIRDTDLRVYAHPIADHLVVSLDRAFAGYAENDIEWPQDWWQAFRERWFPRWWLKRWPVRKNSQKVYKGVFPNVTLPTDAARMIAQLERLEAVIHGEREE